MTTGLLIMACANFITGASYVAEKSNIWQAFLSKPLQKYYMKKGINIKIYGGCVTWVVKYTMHACVFTFLMKRNTLNESSYRWILIDWSWWPWVSIMTSASSKTKTFTFFRSITRNFMHQSRTVPGVPMMMWSVSFSPRVTEKTMRLVTIATIKPHKFHCSLKS